MKKHQHTDTTMTCAHTPDFGDHNYSVLDSAKVLIVDDSEVNLEFISGMLPASYQKIKANRGVEALRLCAEWEPDIILLDIKMDDMDGLEVCRRIKASARLKDIPVIFITGAIDRQLEDQCWKAGAADFLNKPVSINSLNSRVKAHIALKLQLDSFRELAIKDGLSKIYNRYYLNNYLESHVRQVRREQQALSLILVDIDKFKNFNDVYGHISGDKCLVDVANSLKNSVYRPLDIVARYGGEEFAVVLPNTDYDNSALIADRILGNIYRLDIPHEGSSFGRVTVSAGMAVYQPGNEAVSVEQILKTADTALYASKNHGRNKLTADFV